MTEKNHNFYNVPQGYFQKLENRLADIPQKRDREAQTVTLWMSARPVLALAASFALLVIAGTAVLRKTSDKVKVENDYDYFAYAYNMIPETAPYSIYDAEGTENFYSEVSSEDIINYLIDTRVSLETLGYEQALY